MTHPKNFIQSTGNFGAEIPLSVCMITYQHAPFIQEALDSILMQKTDFPIEICIGEDGSTDGTREICQEYAVKYPELIRLFLRDRSDPARKAYKAPFMHNCVETLRACRGKYIALCEGDDYWTDPLKLQKQVDALEGHPEYSLCFHDTYSLDASTKEKKLWRRYHRRASFTLEDTLGVVCLCHTSSLLVRTKCVHTLPKWFSKIASGDMGLLFLAGLSGDLIRIPQAMSVYRKHATGATSSAPHLGEQWDINRIQMLLCFKKHIGNPAPTQLADSLYFHSERLLGHTGRKRKTTRLVHHLFSKQFHTQHAGAFWYLLHFALKRAPLGQK